jgi:Fe-S-cluster containining protein
MKQLVPEGYCLSCQGCCRFAGSQSSWVTKLLPAEQAALGVQGQAVPLVECPAQALWYCAYLDPVTNACSLYARRPLECRLYPFVLNRRGNAVFLAYDVNCRFVQEQCGSKGFAAYAQELAAYLCSAPVREQLEGAGYMLAPYEGAIDCAYLFGCKDSA